MAATWSGFHLERDPLATALWSAALAGLFTFGSLLPGVPCPQEAPFETEPSCRSRTELTAPFELEVDLDEVPSRLLEVLGEEAPGAVLEVHAGAPGGEPWIEITGSVASEELGRVLTELARKEFPGTEVSTLVEVRPEPRR